MTDTQSPDSHQPTAAPGSAAPGSGARRPRTATISRTTRESSIELTLDIDGTGQVDVSTSVPFFDHMLTALGTHARFDLTVKATGDVHIDAHHTVEDTSIVLGQALREALGDKRGIARFGDAMVPLDESLAQAVVDLSGRPYCVHSGESEAQALHLIGGHFTGSLTRHVFESIAHHAAICLHIRLLEGRDPHHVVEAQFKALARALRAACAYDDRVLDVPSTKGAL
ncbi:imidazoleglycerol-phosphate dehydratase HisB [Brachybacterium sp.]|uniref:imidazoleglycerol-phosphate dehydratase HisB n=1 Tax=Brachybacterium sp. TaxID=1891286 RepID=UPI002ED2FBCC